MPIGDGDPDDMCDRTGTTAVPFLGLVRMRIVTPAMENQDEDGRNALPLGIIDVDMDMVSTSAQVLFLLVLRTKPNHRDT